MYCIVYYCITLFFKAFKEYLRAESAAFDACEFKLEAVEKREKTRSLFENVQVEFSYKEKRTNEELREATRLRNEAAQAADEEIFFFSDLLALWIIYKYILVTCQLVSETMSKSEKNDVHLSLPLRLWLCASSWPGRIMT